MNALKKFLSGLEAVWPFVLGLSLAWFVSGLLVGGGRHQPAQARASFAATPESAASRIIEERNILNLENPLPQAAVSGPDPASWKLLGIFSSSRPMVLLLIDGKSKTVKLGEVENGWTLESISSNTASFKSGSQERMLNIFKEAPAASLTKGSKNKLELSKSEVVPVLKDPGALLQQALFKPNLDGDKTNGYRISNIQDHSLLTRLGFLNGDILLRINGEVIDGPAKMMQLYSGLQSAQAVNMDIKRGGELLSLVVELK